jgi:dTMP kinase
MAAKRGVFILIEGLDRCGKTTQNKRLNEWLVAAGHQSQQIGFPDRATPTGQLIDAHLTRKVRICYLFATYCS